jgi:hypothetical protein
VHLDAAVARSSRTIPVCRIATTGSVFRASSTYRKGAVNPSPRTR